MILLGNKVNEIAEKYFVNNKKRPMISEAIQLIESENSKRNKRSAILIKNQIILKKNIEFEVEKKIEKIRTEKKKIKLIPKKKSNIILKVGDDVRILDSKSIGTIAVSFITLDIDDEYATNS
jgi:DNA mismatch repair protein MutS2